MCPLWGRGRVPAPLGAFRADLARFRGASGEGKMGPPARPSAAGSLGRGGAVERVSFRPCGAETRAVELATTTSRRKRRGRGPAGAATTARSADSFPLRGRAFPEPPKWDQGGRPGGKARGFRENRGVPGREKEIGQQSVVEGRTAAHGCRDAPVPGATAVQILPRRVKERRLRYLKNLSQKSSRRGLAISKRFGYCVLLTRRRYTCTTT